MTRTPKTAPRQSVTRPSPATRRGRISKTKAQNTIRVATSTSRSTRKLAPSPVRSPSLSSPRLSRTPSPSSGKSRTPTLSSTYSTHSRHLSSGSVGRLATILEKGFKNVGRQIRQSSHSNFEQLADHLDGAFEKLGSPSTNFKRGEIVNTGTFTKPLVSTPSSGVNVLKRWSWVDQAT